jgi:hypothetical protein
MVAFRVDSREVLIVSVKEQPSSKIRPLQEWCCEGVERFSFARKNYFVQEAVSKKFDVPVPGLPKVAGPVAYRANKR